MDMVLKLTDCGLKESWAVVGRQHDCHSCNCPGPSLDKEALVRWKPVLADRVLRHLASLEFELRFHPMLRLHAAHHEPLNSRDRRVSHKPASLQLMVLVLNPRDASMIVLCLAG